NSAIPVLQMKIIAEGKLVEEKIKQFIEDWNTSKPLAGTNKFTDALETLTIFEGRVARLKEESGRIVKAKEALNLEISKDDQLKPIEEEMLDLKGVWSELANVWQDVESLKETPWTAVVPRKVRRSLEDMLTKLKGLPNRMRQYSAFEHMQNQVKGYLKG